ncbi:MAG: GNAT family N-acetyltransferase [Hyphomicrobiaceae bacterium]
MIVRDWHEADLAALHAINEASVPGVGSLTFEALDRLVRDQSAATLVAESGGEPVGFVLCMLEGLDYPSLNYKWVSARYDRFAYVDRVAVAEDQRGKRVGEALYVAAIERFAGAREVLLAEVNLAPPNPGSLRFHKRNGFVERGERWEIEGEKGVVYLERKLG